MTGLGAVPFVQRGLIKPENEKEMVWMAGPLFLPGLFTQEPHRSEATVASVSERRWRSVGEADGCSIPEYSCKLIG